MAFWDGTFQSSLPAFCVVKRKRQTGAFLVKGENLPVYKAVQLSKQWPPKFTKVRIYFEDGTELAYVDSRRLGKVRIQNDPEHESPIGDLALDPVLDAISVAYLTGKFQRANTAIKNVLLDQERVLVCAATA